MGSAAGYVVLTKPGCVWCDRAKDLLTKNGVAFDAVEFDSVQAVRDDLARRGLPHDHVTSVPQVIDGQTYVGGYAQLADRLEEPLLADNASRRFTPFPVEHEDVFEAFKKGVATFWTADEVSLAEDVKQWTERLTADERHFIEHVLAFFAGADGIVMENLNQNFGTEVKAPEARLFYAYQTYNEAIHSWMYGLLIDALIADPARRDTLFRAIREMPAVAKKAAWATKWLNPTRRFAERLLGFMCVEGIMFSGSFCAIFWLKQRGLMPGLGLSNEFISRDEGQHQDFGALMYSKLRHRLTQEEAAGIVREAVENEKEFITDAIPCRLVGMNADLMAQYIEFVADRLLTSIGHAPIYGARNPFTWMQLISLPSKDNFFEKFGSTYQKAGAMADAKDQTFGLDEDF